MLISSLDFFEKFLNACYWPSFSLTFYHHWTSVNANQLIVDNIPLCAVCPWRLHAIYQYTVWSVCCRAVVWSGFRETRYDQWCTDTFWTGDSLDRRHFGTSAKLSVRHRHWCRSVQAHWHRRVTNINRRQYYSYGGISIIKMSFNGFNAFMWSRNAVYNK